MDAYPWTECQILIWVSIYWFSSTSVAARLRIYYKALNGTQLGRDRKEKPIPHFKLVLAHFPQERLVVPKCWGRTMGPLVYESENESGGHFIAWERPEAIVRDLHEMLGKGQLHTVLVKKR